MRQSVIAIIGSSILALWPGSEAKAVEFHIEQSGLGCDGNAVSMQKFENLAHHANIAFQFVKWEGDAHFVLFNLQSLRANPERTKTFFLSAVSPDGMLANAEIECGVLERPVGTLAHD